VYTQYSIKPGTPPVGLSFDDLNEYVAMPLLVVYEALRLESTFLWLLSELLLGQPLSLNEPLCDTPNVRPVAV
jgi:hypothetical protein